MNGPKKLTREGGRVSRALNLLALLITAAAYVPFVISARYALFHGDDFSFCIGTFAEPTGELLKASLLSAWNTYITWQGTWFTNILNPLLNPLNWYSFSFLRLLLIGCLAASFFVLLFLSHEICAFLGSKDREGILLAAFLLPLVCSRSYYEVYLWHVGAMAYQVPILFQALGLALLLRAERKQSAPVTGLAMFCLLLSGGGVLLIGGLGACLTLLLTLTDWLEKRKLNRRYAFAFLAVLVGDLINVAAPGNYVKAPGELPLFKAFGDAMRVAAYEFGFQLSHLVFPAAMLVGLIIGLRLGKRLRAQSFALAMLGLLLTPVVTAFPFMLGYNVSTPDIIADRAWFVIDTAIIFCTLCIAVLLGGQFCAAICDKHRSAFRLGAGAIAAVLLLCRLPRMGESMPVQVAENLRNGKIAAYASEWHEIFDMLSMRPGENVVIEWQPEPCVGVHAVSLGAAPDHPVNYHMARYFGNAGIVDAWYAATYGVPDSGESTD